MGDGAAPEIPDAVRHELSRRYQESYRVLTGRDLAPGALSVEEELERYAAVVREARSRGR